MMSGPELTFAKRRSQFGLELTFAKSGGVSSDPN